MTKPFQIIDNNTSQSGSVELPDSQPSASSSFPEDSFQTESSTNKISDSIDSIVEAASYRHNNRTILESDSKISLRKKLFFVVRQHRLLFYSLFAFLILVGVLAVSLTRIISEIPPKIQGETTLPQMPDETTTVPSMPEGLKIYNRSFLGPAQRTLPEILELPIKRIVASQTDTPECSSMVILQEK